MADQDGAEGGAVLPYARIPEEPIVVKDRGEFLTMAKEVVTWIRSDPDEEDRGKDTDKDKRRTKSRLRVGALWGGRGSGKTSMLLTILNELQEEEGRKKQDRLPIDPAADLTPVSLRLPDPNNDSPRPGPWALFEPSSVVDGDRLFFRFLGFLHQRYLGGARDREFAKAFEHEAKAIDPGRFLDYERDVATSPDKLRDATVKFYQEHGQRTQFIREDIEKVLEDRGRLVVLVDDLDLQPQHAHDLLQFLHTYFRCIDMVVVLAADHQLLLSSIDRSLKKRKVDSAGLGAQLLAKFIVAEWRLPMPTMGERRAQLLGPPINSKEPPAGHRWFDFNGWWEGFRTPAQSINASGERAVAISSRRDSVQAEVTNPADQVETYKNLFAKASPTTWRGLNRLRNRALDLESLHGSVDALADTYSEAVGSSKANVPSFLALLLAVDEAVPELLLFRSFEDDPERLRTGIAPAARDDSERELSARRRDEDGATRRPSTATSVWNIAIPEDAELYPVRDRLLEPSVINGQRRGRAEDLLHLLGTVWQKVWGPSLREEGGISTFLAISVYDDAHARSQPWRQRLGVDADDIVHADLRRTDATDRPTASEMRALCKQLERDYGETIKRNDQQIFAVAPLSVAAWVGWYGRYGNGLKVIGDDREQGFQVFTPADPYQSTELGLTFFHDPIRAPADQLDERSRNAAILLDVRPNPDRSPMLQAFRGPQGEAVRFVQAIKLASEPGFRLVLDHQVADIIHDLRVVMDSLRRDYAVDHIHLAFACPVALAILVGRVLHPWTPIRLYEYEPRAEPGPVYDYVIDLG